MEKTAKDLFTALRSGDITALGRALTYIESASDAGRKQADILLSQALSFSSDSVFRIGITGVGGVGKSSFIASLGAYLLAQDSGHRLAILAIDPTSPSSSGSVMGDKTRMGVLLGSDRVYIRPSPHRLHTGGLAITTADSMAICEAAGYNIIIVETMGVGQGEWAIHYTTDVCVLLVMAGMGDALQGIKRGLQELADIMVVHKADAHREKEAEEESRRLQHLFPSASVLTASSHTHKGIDALWNTLISLQSRSDWSEKRKKQREWLFSAWLKKYMEESAGALFESAAHLRSAVRNKEQTARAAARQMYRQINKA